MIKRFPLELIGKGKTKKRKTELTKKRILKIKKIERFLTSDLNEIRQKVKEIKKSNSYLTIQDERQLIENFKNFRIDLVYLKEKNLFENNQYLETYLEEVGESQKFVSNYNKDLQIKILTNKIKKSEGEISRAEKDFSSKYNSNFYYSKKDLYDWKEKWSSIKPLLFDFQKYKIKNIDFEDSMNNLFRFFEKGEELIKKRLNFNP